MKDKVNQQQTVQKISLEELNSAKMMSNNQELSQEEMKQREADDIIARYMEKILKID